MSQTTERDGVPPSAPTRSHDVPGTGLSRPIQEHLGRELRTTYNADAPDKPAYLGDPVLPVLLPGDEEDVDVGHLAPPRFARLVTPRVGIPPDCSRARSGRHAEPIAHHVRFARRDGVVVERRHHPVQVVPRDPLPVAVESRQPEPVRVRIHVAIRPGTNVAVNP